MKIVQLHEKTPKQFLIFSSIPLRPPKSKKMTPKLSKNQMSELKETKRMKVVQLHEQTSKLLLHPTPTPKLAH